MEYLLTINEAEVLDNIIDIVIKKDSISISDLPKLPNKTGDNYLDYDYFLKILQADNIIEIIHFGKTGSTIHPVDHITNKFINDGGYANVYKNQQEEIQQQTELNELTLMKLRWDSKLSKWQAKTFWWVFLIGLIGGICGVISLIISLNK